MRKHLKIGTRGSKLALWQANHISDLMRQLHPGIEISLEIFKTTGDRVLDRPLAEIGGKGLFVKEIEDALLDGRVDLAIHSLKDVPAELPTGLGLVAFLKREDPRDAICTNVNKKLAELPAGSRVGTSSLRRRIQLQRLRPDLTFLDLRGNVDTRFRKLDAGEYDAIVLAAAGLNRLGWTVRATELVGTDKMIPAIGQGILGVETRIGDADTIQLLQPLKDPAAESAAICERSLLGRMGGSCWLPLGGYAQILPGSRLLLTAFLSSIDGTCFFRHQTEGSDPAALGRETADTLLAAGGADVLREIEAHHARQ